jgi:hypothetical protein
MRNPGEPASDRSQPGSDRPQLPAEGASSADQGASRRALRIAVWVILGGAFGGLMFGILYDAIASVPVPRDGPRMYIPVRPISGLFLGPFVAGAFALTWEIWRVVLRRPTKPGSQQ